MRLSIILFSLLVVCAVGQEVRRATLVDDAPVEVAVSSAPVDLPPLTDYARLWTESLFTTRAIPAPSVQGPSFADNLSLSGTYELNGKMVAILIDKTTSTVVEAYIGEDNASGIRIAKVEPGATPDAMRLQLQKGTEVGWVSFADAAAIAASSPEPNPQPMVQNEGMTPMPKPPRPQSNVSIPPQAPAPQPQYAPPPPSSLPGGPVPGMNQGLPQMPPQIDDVPLPPS
jgi:hypothetical protein